MVAPELNKSSRKSKLVLQKSVGYLETCTSECPDFNSQDIEKYWIFDLQANKIVNCNEKLFLILGL